MGSGAALAIDPAESAGSTFRVALGPGSSLILEGDSTLHRWSSQSSALRSSGLAELPGSPEGGAPAAEIARRGRLRQLEVRVPVVTLKSGNDGLDDNMYAALKAKAHPEIVFSLERYELDPQPSAAGEHRLTGSGRLTVAGETREVAFSGRALVERGELRVRGEAGILMTDFGVTPPTFLLGAMSARNEVLVRFNVVLKLAGAAQTGEGKRSDT